MSHAGHMMNTIALHQHSDVELACCNSGWSTWAGSAGLLGPSSTVIGTVWPEFHAPLAGQLVKNMLLLVSAISHAPVAAEDDVAAPAAC